MPVVGSCHGSTIWSWADPRQLFLGRSQQKKGFDFMKMRCRCAIAASVVFSLIFALVFRCDTKAASPASVIAEEQEEHSQVPEKKVAEAGASVRMVSFDSENHESKPKALLANWEKPAVAIVLSGEQHGYFEPCGCTDHQLGGLSRRGDLFRRLKEEKGWTVTAFDLGGIVKRNRQQARIKFQTLLAAHRDLGYQAMALGPEELRFDPLFLLSQHVTDPDHPERSLSFLSANVVLLGTRDLGTPLRAKIIRVNGVTLGVTAVLGASLQKTVFGSDSSNDVTFEDPAKSLTPVVEELQQQQPDLMLLLSQSSLAETKQLARKFPQFQLILSAGGIEDPLSDNPQFVGKTMIATVGGKAKYCGVVGFYPDKSDRPLRFELVTLDENRFHDTPAMRDHMRFYQDQLRDLKLVETEAETLAVAPPRDAKYVGAERCGECHTEAYDQWKGTGHAKAFESLVHGHDGTTSRIYDPECIACHVVGWDPQKVVPFKSGYVSKEKTGHLIGVQCENCHGPGSAHIKFVNDDNLTAARQETRIKRDDAERSLCYSCHDLDNSPSFDFEKYWPQVEHRGLD